MRQVGLKKFIVKSLIFIMPFGLIPLFVEYKLGQVPNSYNVKKRLLERHAPEIQAIVMGSSHAYVGIDPKALGCRAFNLANTSQTLYYDSQLLSKYLDRMTSLRLAIITLSYFSLEFRLTDSPEQWRSHFYYYHYGIRNETSNWPLLDLRNYSLIALYGINETRRISNLGYRVNFAEQVDENGWFKSPDDVQTLEASEASAQRNIGFHHGFMKPKYIAENLFALQTMIRNLQARKVAVVFVTIPVFHTYAERMSAEKYQTMQEQIERLCQTYGIEYFNYSFDPRFTIEDFQNADHLNLTGAEKFSAIIKGDFVDRYVNPSSAGVGL
jgi:hypothetical protein